jgi:hypothetical protein
MYCVHLDARHWHGLLWLASDEQVNDQESAEKATGCSVGQQGSRAWVPAKSLVSCQPT